MSEPTQNERRTRWTFEVPADAAVPKGPQTALEEAVQILVTSQPVSGEKTRDPGRRMDDLLKNQARDKVGKLARSFNEAIYQVKDAPRLGDILANLQRIEASAAEFAAALDASDAWSRFFLTVPGEIGDLCLSKDELSATRACLPQPDSSAEGILADRARKAARLARGTIERVRDYYGGADASDKGGRQNHYERYMGSPKTGLVTDCFEVFELFRPGVASSTDGSPFFRFVHAVYEFATADFEEDSAKLAHRLRSLITPLRQLQKNAAERSATVSARERAHPDSQEYRDLDEREFMLISEHLDLLGPLLPLLTLGRSLTAV